MKKSIIFFLTIISLCLVYVLYPSPINPQAYNPPSATPMTGPWSPNESLKTAKLWAKGEIIGPEDVAIDEAGNLYGGLENGQIIRVDRNNNVTVFADTKGRPLGLHFDRFGNLIVADALEGLLSVSPAGDITTLTTEADGIPLGFTDDLDITKDGIILFSDASTRWGVWEYKQDALEAIPYGRLVAYNPKDKSSTVLLKDLHFANGIAVSQDDSFVLINETWRYRVTRYWLKGPKKGQSDIFIDNLPGFPDGISSNKQGTFWLAIAAPRNALLDGAHPYPWMKKQMAKLPKFLQPQAQPYGMVVALSEQGTVLQTLQDTTGSQVSEITSVEQYGNRLLLGTLNGDRIGEVPVPKQLQ